jgi:hypothetical protein
LSIAIEIFGLILLGLVFWFWSLNRTAQETAKQSCLQICRQSNVELLDDTVACEVIRPVRDLNSGRLSLKRVFVFDYIGPDELRKSGMLIMQGNSINLVKIDTDSSDY